MIDALANRDHYPILESQTYLNQASLGLIGAPAAAAMHSFLDDVARHGNVFMNDREEIGFSESLRTRAARMLNCSSDQLAITAGASELLGQLPTLIDSGNANEIVLISTDFPALTRPWVLHAESTSSVIRWAKDSPDCNLTDTVIESLSDSTGIVSVSHVQYATGSILDIERLQVATSRVGAVLIVDVTQSAGIYPIDSAAWGADVIVASGYKWLGGHGGVAISYLSRRMLDKLPSLAGWMGSPSPFQFDATSSAFSPSARKFTLSTMSYISMVGLTASIEQLNGENPGGRVNHAQKLGRYLMSALDQSGWRSSRELSSPVASAHILSLRHDERDSDQIISVLRDSAIHCSSRLGGVRVSLAPFVNSTDLDRLATALISSR